MLIPHNSNLSGREQWLDPADGSEARRRQRLEPLVEIHQQKGNTDASAVRQIDDNLRDNPGGLTFVWAEENSRDALFAGLKRRETYATSGTRPQVRFFAGILRDVRCDAADLVARAYASGTPMGGDLGAVNGDSSPSFAVLAFKDAGGSGAPSTDLQRVQIVKGWVDTNGEAQEKVYDVAGGASAAAVDSATCEPVGNGEATLCAVWSDPDFQRSERAFYYARVLENPTCRWSTLVCKRAGVDPFAPDCAAQAAAVDARYADCCLAAGSDPILSPVVQERAWTSPIWYRPESIAAVRGAIAFGATPATDVLELEVTVGRLADGITPDGTEMNLTLGDDDAIYGVTVPAGLLRQTAPGHYALDTANAEPRGLRALALDVAPSGEVHLMLTTQGRSLRSAQRTAHFVTLELRLGEERLAHSRLWRLDGERLSVADE